MPVRAAHKIIFQERSAYLYSFFTCLIAKGIIINEAVDHRKKARLTGGTCLETPRAITKLPDQINTAKIARPIPVIVFLFSFE